MDAEMKVVSPGGTGELWISGSGVARGYFHLPDLTAERFLADPFVSRERMYRTGDEVRQHENGVIEFIGRLDQQVKLRGFRIELGEIEAAMLAVPGLREAVAMLREDASGEGFLAGVYSGEGRLTDEDLRRVMRRQLPAYMLPKIFLRLESLPLTPNGKTDRRALAGLPLATPSGYNTADEGGSAHEVEEFAVPELERRMLRIWQKLFPEAAIVDESDFFNLGGDSFLLVRLQSMLIKEFDLRLTIADATRYYTFTGLVGWARSSALRADCPAEAAEEQDPAVLPLQTGGSGSPVFIIPQMLIFRTLAEELGQEQPFYALQVLDEEVPDELASVSFEELAVLYCKHIRQLQPQGPYRLGGWCLWGWMAYEVARRLESEGAEVEMLVIIDAWAPGYWKRYPPVRQFLVNASHFWQRLSWYADSMRSIPVRERIEDGLRRVREVATAVLQALPRGLRPQLEVVETLRIQQFASKAAESYIPGPIKGNVVLFKSELRPTGPFVGKDMGWSAILGRQVRLDALPGNHNDIFNHPAARIMASRMREVLGLSPAADGGDSSSE